jgi:hypothetical protein
VYFLELHDWLNEQTLDEGKRRMKRKRSPLTLAVASTNAIPFGIAVLHSNLAPVPSPSRELISCVIAKVLSRRLKPYGTRISVHFNGMQAMTPEFELRAGFVTY